MFRNRCTNQVCDIDCRCLSWTTKSIQKLHWGNLLGLNYLINKAAANIILHPGGQFTKTKYAMLLKFYKCNIRKDSLILRIVFCTFQTFPASVTRPFKHWITDNSYIYCRYSKFWNLDLYMCVLCVLGKKQLLTEGKQKGPVQDSVQLYFCGFCYN